MQGNMRFKCSQVSIALLIGFSGISHLAFAEDEPSQYSFMDAIKAGKNLTSFRLRYENVSQDGNGPAGTSASNKPLEDAHGITLRSLIGWQTAPYHDVSVGAQIISVGKLDDNFNDSTPFGSVYTPASNQPNKVGYAKIVDPDYTGVNQLFLDWTGIQKTKIRLGRQQVNLDNVRFIGDIGFRQVMQVFDGVSVLNQSIEKTDVYLAHFEAVRQTNTKLRTDGSLEIANINYHFSPTESLVGYGYLSSFDDLGFGNAWFGAGTLNNGTLLNSNADQSNKVLGLRLNGAHKINDDWKVLYTAEYAKQSSYASGDSRIDADYYKIGGGAAYDNFSLRIDQELLGSNDGKYAFQTPFGTNHLFQGWVDKFLATPKEGIQDSFITATYKYGNLLFFADYHVYNSDVDFYKATGGKGDKYGTEWNTSVTYNFDKNITTKIEYGKYSESDQYQPTATLTQASRIRDTEKLWLTATYSF